MNAWISSKLGTSLAATLDAGAGAQAPGEEFGAALGHRAADVRRQVHAVAAEGLGIELLRLEAAAVEQGAGQRLGQRPVRLGRGEEVVGVGHGGDSARPPDAVPVDSRGE